MKIAWLFLCLVVLTGAQMAGRAGESGAGWSGSSDYDVAINEILADPPDGEDGDANGDGERNTYGDEFVEIYNAGSDTVNLRGWRLTDAAEVRHEFPDSIDVLLGPGQFATVFGGGVPVGFDGPVWVASTGRLSLNNGDDRVSLVSSLGDTVDAHSWGSEGGHNESLIRVPDGTGGWTRPSEQDWDWRFSPQAPNRGETATVGATWGRIKRRYGADG
jgi:hypothetical protein